jgi:hypothetical protein
MATTRTGRWSGLVAAACAVFELLEGCATALLVYVGSDPFAGGTERVWGLVGSVSAIVQLVAAGMTVAFLFRRQAANLRKAVVAAKAAAGASLFLALIGVAATIAVKRHGGDSALYAVIGNFILCFVAPVILAAIGAAVFLVLRRLPTTLE